MRTIWTRWSLADMVDAADLEGRTALDCLEVPEQQRVESLPYHYAFSEYRMHVTGCTPCRREDRMDCAEGEALLEIAHIGVAEQHGAALNN